VLKQQSELAAAEIMGMLESLNDEIISKMKEAMEGLAVLDAASQIANVIEG